MGPVAFALSVHHFISSVGSDAGFAAIIGLAILVLLYFAQARETASLREQAYQSAQRVQQLEARLAQLLRSQAESGPPSAQPAPAAPVFPRQMSPPAATAAAAKPAVAGAHGAVTAPPPAAPAGVGAPALTAATRLIPLPLAASAEAPALAPQPDGAPLRAPQPAGPAVAAPRPGAPAVPTRPSTTGPLAPAAPVPAAATVAAQRSATPALGASPAGTAANGAGGLAPENGTGHGPAVQAGAPPPRVQLRPQGSGSAGRFQAPAPRGQVAGAPRRRGMVRVLAGLLALVAVGGAVALLLAVTSGGGKREPAASSTSNSNATVAQRRSHAVVAFEPASVTVAVLNGTPTAGLAASFSQRLGRDGYKLGRTTNAADQTQTSTIVAYVQGHKAAALHVASSLGLAGSSVQPIDQNAEAIACPPPTACVADVVVTLGSDLTSHA